jgi:hypothetical protein
MSWLPTPSEERWIALARSLGRNPRAAPFAQHTGGWRTAHTWSRCVLFILGIVATIMLMIIGSHSWPALENLITALVSIGLAEWLIIRQRHFASGIEEALEIAGLSVIAEYLWANHPSASLVGALQCVAFGIAGFRLLNPLFTTGAALALVLALDAPPLRAGLACYGMGLAALVAGAYRFRRPSHDRMLDYLVIVMPVAGYLWSASRHGLSSAADYRHATFTDLLVPASPLLYGAAALAMGIGRRTHSPIIAAMLCVACCAYELRKLTGLSLEVRLILWGSALLFISMTLERYLRVPRRGITSRALGADRDPHPITELVGSAMLTPGPAAVDSPASFAGSGRSGGAGASGTF